VFGLLGGGMLFSLSPGLMSGNWRSIISSSSERLYLVSLFECEIPETTSTTDAKSLPQTCPAASRLRELLTP